MLMKFSANFAPGGLGAGGGETPGDDTLLSNAQPVESTGKGDPWSGKKPPSPLACKGGVAVGGAPAEGAVPPGASPGGHSEGSGCGGRAAVCVFIPPTVWKGCGGLHYSVSLNNPHSFL